MQRKTQPLRQGRNRKKYFSLCLLPSIPCECLPLDKPQGKVEAGNLDYTVSKAQLPPGSTDHVTEGQGINWGSRKANRIIRTNL